MDNNSKMVIGVVAMLCMALIQVFAWYTGHNGQVFALTTGVFTAIVGYFIGWSKNVKESVSEYLDTKID